jgi:hypothetical protein
MDFEGTIICDHYVGNPPVKYVLTSCPRCLRKGVYGGIHTEETGDISVVKNNKYLEQAIKKILVSEMNSRGYGFNYRLISGVIDPSTTNVIKREIIRCTTFLKDEQQRDIRRGVIYSPTEEIRSIENIGVIQDITEPRKILIKFTVIAKSRDKINISQLLTT